MICGTMMNAYLRTAMPMAMPSFSQPPTTTKRCRNLRTVYAATNKAKLHSPNLNPNDSFLTKLATIAYTSPERLLKRTPNPDTPPFMDIVDSSRLMSTPAEVERAVAYNEHQNRSPPPDLPSVLLHRRVVYIGMPWRDPKAPIYIYINSTGTTRDDGHPVAHESEGFTIYDSMMQLQNEIHTLCLGTAIGQACLILSAGTKGKRVMMSNARAMLQEPRITPSGLKPASDVAILAKEAMYDRNTLVELLAKHTGNTEERVSNVMDRGPFYMNAKEAIEFGVVDKIFSGGNEKYMADA